MRRLWSLWLAAVCLLAAVAGCASGPSESDPDSDAGESAVQSGGPAVFSLPYNREDTLNPFAVKTEVNLLLSGLLYDSLTVIDGSFTPRNSLAESVNAVDATRWEVTLRKGAVFSDGTAVTPQDVIVSFQKARASANYQALLSCVSSAEVNKKTGVITFVFSAAVPQPTACFSFPVVKAATLTDGDGKAPVGGGLYTVQQTEDAVVLAVNPHSGQTPRYATVGLKHLPNSETMYYGLTGGSITYYYNDLNDGEIPRVSGANAAVDMNALMFLGINGSHEGLKDAAVRRALSLLIDRKALAATACSGWAKPAAGPFHPAWSGAAGSSVFPVSRDLVEAVKLLESAGYGNAAGQKILQLELIYSRENGSRGAVAELIRTELEGAGVRVTLTPLAYQDYLARLKAGKYGLYLGDIRLPASMDMRYFFAGGSAGYGVPGTSAAAAAYQSYLEGTATVAEFAAALAEDMPFVPLCWRCGYAGYDRRLSGVTPHGYDPYFGFGSWR